jgi:hypothetical protein
MNNILLRRQSTVLQQLRLKLNILMFIHFSPALREVQLRKPFYGPPISASKARL